jgi:hypothetical protein
MRASLKLLSEVRDLQVIDSEENNCGICDDIAFSGAPGRKLAVEAILIGPGAMQKRLPKWAAGLVGWISGKSTVSVPWSEVESITGRIRLKKSAGSYGFGGVDGRLAKYLSKVPAL